MWRIFFLVICIPKRNAIVMRRIENEHGWTLSRTAERRTRGRSHVPLLLTLQKSCAVSGLYFKKTIAENEIVTIASKVRILFIRRLWSNYYPYIKSKHSTS